MAAWTAESSGLTHGPIDAGVPSSLEWMNRVPTPADAVAASDSGLPGPYPVGSYADRLRRRLQEFARVQLIGEVWGFRPGRARVYFELRDPRGALPCSMWQSDFDALGVTLTDGAKVVVGGGCDYYPG